MPTRGRALASGDPVAGERPRAQAPDRRAVARFLSWGRSPRPPNPGGFCARAADLQSPAAAGQLHPGSQDLLDLDLRAWGR